MLSTPLTYEVLRALADGPKRQVDLRHATGSPAQTTLRAQLKRLVKTHVIEQHRRNRFPGVHEYELTEAGHELLFVADVLERWLEKAPHGSLRLGGTAAKAAIKALADGWSAMILRALAAGPLSLTQLDGVIGSLSYPALERRLAAMRLTGLTAPVSAQGRGTPFVVTEWLRTSMAPMAASVRWERRHAPHTTPPIGRLDVETALLLSLPLLRLPEGVSGICRMAVEVANGDRLAGVVVDVRDRRVVSCATQLQNESDAWVVGTPAPWLAATIDGDARHLELGGDRNLAHALLNSLHSEFFDTPGQSGHDLDVDLSIRDDGSN